MTIRVSRDWEEGLFPLQLARRTGSSDAAPGGRGVWGSGHTSAVLMACYCLPSSDGWPPNVLLQCSQSVQGISGHAQRGSQISKHKSLVPFDSMRKGPCLWEESPVLTHYRPKASSEPLSHVWGTAPWESGIWATAGPGTPPCRGGAVVQPGWSPTSFKYWNCLGSRALRCMWAWRRPRAGLQGAEHWGSSGPLYLEPQPPLCYLNTMF